MVAVPYGQTEGFVRRLDPAVTAVLIYGPDLGQVGERAARITEQVVPDRGDPFRVVELSSAEVAKDPVRLADEVAAMAMTGGRRLVRLRSAGNDAAAAVAGAIEVAHPDTLLLVEAGDLKKGSALRTLFEKAEAAAAVPCYGDKGRDIALVIQEALSASGLQADRDAVAYLAEHLGNDRLVTRRELEKLALYVGDGGRVTLADAAACVGDSTALSLDDVVFAVAGGDHRRVGRALSRLALEGVRPITILRAAQRHFQRLHQAIGQVAGGASPEQALDRLRPPVHFSRKAGMKSQVEAWNRARIATALELLTNAEIDCKSTGMPDTEICDRVLMQITEAARRRRA